MQSHWNNFIIVGPQVQNMGDQLHHIFLVQMDVIFGEPDINLEFIKETLQNESIPKDTLVVLPELFLTGYSRDAIIAIGENFSNSKILDKLVDLCISFDIFLFGSIPEKGNDVHYNTAILLSKEGLIAKYRKSHLFGPMGEKQLFKSGKEIVVSDLFDKQIGLSICYDLRFPELYQEQVKQGAEILLVCAEWPITRVDHWTALLKGRAIENQCFVIGLNRVGKDPEYEYGGHSVVFSPFGNKVAELAHNRIETKLIEIDLLEIDNFRNKFDVRLDKWLV